jgi:hypothetical protein
MFILAAPAAKIFPSFLIFEKNQKTLLSLILAASAAKYPPSFFDF